MFRCGGLYDSCHCCDDVKGTVHPDILIQSLSAKVRGKTVEAAET